MKSISLLVALLLCLSFVQGQTQPRERLVYEIPRYFTGPETDPVRTLLFANGGLYPYWQILLQTVCFSPSKPAWAVQVYYPLLYSRDSVAGTTTAVQDTTQVIVEVKKAVSAISFKNTDIKAMGKKATLRKRPIPVTYLPELLQAFTATLELAHWPTDTDLLNLDGDTYHFTVCNGPWRHQTYMWAMAPGPSSDSRTGKLADLAATLVKYAEASTDSAARVALEHVHELAKQLSP